MNSFKGKKALITGATKGIGRAITQAFLEQGAYVVGLYGSDEAAAEALSGESKQKNWPLELFRCDVADAKAVDQLFAKLETELDTIDILVNNAGIRKDGITALMDIAQWQRVLDINLTGTFNLSRQAVKLMLKQKYGRIINITSPAAHLGIQGQANYAASKAGQIGFSRTLAKEVAKKKITVNCVSPGFIKTDFINDLTEEQLSAYKKMVPMRRFGTVEEVADLVLFLASEKASYITGTTIEVTGGL